ncbi:MAG: FtsQ-type POTRA domain-containing protein [Rhodospirillaceae bacterium]|nr:FtsQ-type POTRA domain-containing protein [Rhodospirillaceae bacterium]
MPAIEPGLTTGVARAGDAVLDASAAAGLRLENLTVQGRVQSRPQDILAAVDHERGAPILAIDVEQTREAIEALPWVKSAQVERKLPQTVHVVIQEKTAFALWQRGQRYTLVDAEGNAIVDVTGQYGDLPLIVGAGAPRAASRLMDSIAGRPNLAGRLRGAVYVGERRWNVLFDSLETAAAVRLPEGDIAPALDRLAALERDHKILLRDLEFIDLRVPGQLIIRVRKPDGAVAPSPAPPIPDAGPKQDA